MWFPSCGNVVVPFKGGVMGVFIVGEIGGACFVEPRALPAFFEAFGFFSFREYCFDPVLFGSGDYSLAGPALVRGGGFSFFPLPVFTHLVFLSGCHVGESGVVALEYCGYCCGGAVPVFGDDEVCFSCAGMFFICCVFSVE